MNGETFLFATFCCRTSDRWMRVPVVNVVLYAIRCQIKFQKNVNAKLVGGNGKRNVTAASLVKFTMFTRWLSLNSAKSVKVFSWHMCENDSNDYDTNEDDEEKKRLVWTICRIKTKTKFGKALRAQQDHCFVHESSILHPWFVDESSTNHAWVIAALCMNHAWTIHASCMNYSFFIWIKAFLAQILQKSAFLWLLDKAKKTKVRNVPRFRRMWIITVCVIVLVGFREGKYRLKTNKTKKLQQYFSKFKSFGS